MGVFLHPVEGIFQGKLTGNDLGIQLLECLEPSLRRDLTRTT